MSAANGNGTGRAPEVSAVVASHARDLRLRWLLNALEEQTLDRSRWELVVVHDNEGDATTKLIEAHPLHEAGVLRHVRLPAGTGTAARQRNVGWREARAPLIAFTDDDCRPDTGWLEALLTKAHAAPGTIVQGTTKPDPFEAAVAIAPRVRTLDVDPPIAYAQTCNILYPRELLELVDGFDEQLPAPAGEDTDLAERVLEACGAELVAAKDARVYHAVESYSLRDMVRVAFKWEHLPYVIKRHPHLRSASDLGIFWKHSHWRLLIAAAGLAGALRGKPALLLVLPYLRHAMFVHGRRPKAVLRSAHELPSRAVIDAAEVIALARGSLRYRTVYL